jgi:3-hydroxyacyl-CoA dehydrogenase
VYLTGYGFPRAKGGPMFHAEVVGLDKVVARMQEFTRNPKAAPDFWQPAKLLAERARAGKRFDQP